MESAETQGTEEIVEQSPQAKEAEAKLYHESEQRRREKAKNATKEDFTSITALKKGEKFVIRNGKILKFSPGAVGSFSTYIGKEKDPVLATLIKKHNIKHG